MKNQRGSILVVTLGFILVFTMFGLGSMYLSTVQNEGAEKRTASTKAFWLADAGIQKAKWEFDHNNCADFVQCGTTTACTSCTSCGSGNKCLSETLGTNGDYDVTMDNTNSLLTSIGAYPNRTVANAPKRTIQISSGYSFNHTLFARGLITLLQNSYTNSYDSSLGDYNAIISGVLNKGSHGDIGTNGTAITLSINATVNGNASTGPGGSVSNPSRVTGSITYSNNVYLPTVIVPSGLTGLSGGTPYSLGENGTATLPAGDYRYTNMNIGKKAKLTIDGDVRLYLTNASAFTSGDNAEIHVNSGASLTIYTEGVVDFSKKVKINNMAKKPSKFLVYSRYTGSNGVLLSDNIDIFGAIYAPDTAVNFGSKMELYGAVMGKTISLLDNNALHYDQSISTVHVGGGGGSLFTSKSWHEL